VAITQEGHPAGLLEQCGDVIEHGIAHVQFDVALVRHHFPSQRQRAVAMREGDAQHLERFVPDKTAIEHDRHLTTSPGLEHLGDEWRIEITADDPATGQPAPDAHDAPSGVRITGNVIGNFAQMD
jgi:hypothetical protein